MELVAILNSAYGIDAHMKSRIAHSYSCLMAVLPDDAVDKLRQFGLSIPDDCIYQDDSGDKGRETEFHTTIKYGIHTKDPEEVKEAIVPLLKPLGARLGKVTVFNGDEYVVLKVSVQSEDLTRMNQAVRQNLECTDTYPDYKPHVTIAYLKKDPKNPLYFQDFCTDEFDGMEVVSGKLKFTTPDKKKYSMSLSVIANKQAVAKELVAIAKNIMEGR